MQTMRAWAIITVFLLVTLAGIPYQSLALRFGWTTFPDNNTLSTDFDPATLGFASSFTNALPVSR